MTKRLEILKNSLLKKEQQFNEKFNEHVASVKQANGQPINDKRNARTTFNRWDKQDKALHNLNKSIEKTKEAIKDEEGKIYEVECSKEIIPQDILELVNNGTLTQWRKHPTIFFVKGVEKARIIWDEKEKKVAHRYYAQVKEVEQKEKFVQVFNILYQKLNK